jgi:hypothetical protein
MAEIPIPDKFKKDDKNPPTCPPPLTYSKDEPFDERCLPKKICRMARQSLGDQVFPICPVLSEIVKDDKWIIPELPKSGAPLLDSINRILCGFGGLLRRFQPDFEVLVWCAHKRFVLDGLTSLIEDDLTNLPLRMEKEFPLSSPKVDKLISQLKAVFRESNIHLLQNLQLYLLPPQSFFEHSDYETFLYWRNEEIYRAKEKDIDERILKDLTCTYPAGAIEVMRKIFDKLSPLVQILPEKVAERNRLIDEVKLTLDEHLNKSAETKQDATDVKKGEDNIKVTIYGNVRARNFQIAGNASIEDKKKGIIEKLLEIIGLIIPFIRKILWHK